MMVSELSQEKNDFLWYTLQSRLNDAKVANAFDTLTENGFRPILIKGWAAARYYPQSWQRQFIDVDICVEPKEYEAAKLLIEKTELLERNIDLHKGLRHLDTVGWEDLYNNSIVIKNENTSVRTLRAEDHLRVLCVHWLTDGGAYKNRLWDIYYLIQNRPVDFDWKRCLEVVSPKRRRWIVCCIGLAHKYLGLDIAGIPVAEEARNLPAWVIRAVEREWQTDIRLKPLHACLRDRKVLWQQIKKRIPPNPVQATIELEGDIDAKPRFIYQFGNVITRLLPSVKRITRRMSEDRQVKK